MGRRFGLVLRLSGCVLRLSLHGRCIVIRFGIRQSGLMDFKLADIFQDASVLREANQAVQEILAADEWLELPEHERIKGGLGRYLQMELAEISI